MRYPLVAALLALSLLTACVAVPGPRGEVVLAPTMPSIVILQDDPYYYNNGYYYWYNNDAWYYSRYRDSRDWQPLPRDRYPREFRYQGRHWHRDRGWNRDDRDRDRDYRDVIMWAECPPMGADEAQKIVTKVCETFMNRKTIPDVTQLPNDISSS